MILSAPLMVGACSPKDKGPSAEKSAPASELELKSPSRKAFAKHFDVPSRKVSEAEANEALQGLSLLESSNENLSWKKSTGKAGNYKYTALTAKSDEGDLTIESAELFGVHMEGETATFDRADFSGIKMFSKEDNVTVTVANMSMARPTPDMAKSIIASISNIQGVDDLDIEMKDEDLGFGALSLDDVNVSSEELNGGLDHIIWGEDESTGLTDILIDGVNFNFESKQGESGELKLDEFSATGLRSSLLKGVGAPTSMMSKFGSVGKNFDEVKLENLSFDSSVFAVNTNGFAGKATEKDGVTTIKQVSEPFTIKLKDAPNSPQAKQAFAMVKELGFEELVFESSQTQIIDSNKDTITVKDGLVSMKDGFNLDYNYSASGLGEFQSKINDKQSSSDTEAAMQALTLNGMQLRLEDRSIVERGLGLAAKFRGASPEQLKKEMKLAISLAPLAAGSGLERDLMKEVGGAVGDFVDGNGKTLSIVMNPSTPIALTDVANLKNSDTSMEALGLTAIAE